MVMVPLELPFNPPVMLKINGVHYVRGHIDPHILNKAQTRERIKAKQ